MVTPEMASKDSTWWRDDRYAIYELSVNSAAAYPQHNEELRIASPEATYTAKGYAYSGGGRRVTRVEISLDNAECKIMSINRIHLPQLTFDPQLGAWQISNIQKTSTATMNRNCMTVK